MAATIRPTHSCFDDALDLLEAFGAKHLVANPNRYTVVHAICSIGGSRFAHAWVEDAQDGLVRIWQGGIVETARIFYVTDRSKMPFVIEREWRYSVGEALRLNHRTNHYGPWEKEVAAWCGNRVVGEGQLDASDLEVMVIVGDDDV